MKKDQEVNQLLYFQDPKLETETAAFEQEGECPVSMLMSCDIFDGIIASKSPNKPKKSKNAHLLKYVFVRSKEAILLKLGDRISYRHKVNINFFLIKSL